MRHLKTERRKFFTVRTYLHPSRGIVRTLAMACEPNVIHVGGNFGVGGQVDAAPKAKLVNRSKRRARR